MPKSKRERKITLSKTAKKGRDRKGAILEEVRGCVDEYTNLFVFSAQSMRNTALKDVRAQLKKSRIFYGRNKLMAAALGRGPSEEYRDGLSQVAQSLLGGETGLIFTNETYESVRRCLEDSQVPEYARSGFEATRDVALGERPKQLPALDGTVAAQAWAADPAQGWCDHAPRRLHRVPRGPAAQR